MREGGSKIETVSATDAERQFGDVLARVSRHGARVIVMAEPTHEAEGMAAVRDVVAIVPLDDLWRLRALEAGELEAFDALWAFGERGDRLPDIADERGTANAIAEGRAETRGHAGWRRDPRGVVAVIPGSFNGAPPKTVEREAARAIAEDRREPPAGVRGGRGRRMIPATVVADGLASGFFGSGGPATLPIDRPLGGTGARIRTRADPRSGGEDVPRAVLSGPLRSRSCQMGDRHPRDLDALGRSRSAGAPDRLPSRG